MKEMEIALKKQLLELLWIKENFSNKEGVLPK